MKKYRIKYSYDSGDSFNQYPDITGFVEIEWDSIENAKNNLKRIEEHYKQYKELESWKLSKEDKQNLLLNNSLKDWFVKKDCLVTFKKDNPNNYWAIDKKDKELCSKGDNEVKTIFDEMTAQNQIILYTDDNKPFQFWCPWCGYFEHLNYCEVEQTKEFDDLKFYA